jgi:hypothetical protein
MKLYVAIVFFIFVLLWIISIALFSGMLAPAWLPEALLKLTVSSSFEGLGNAMATLDGLFSSIAIVLGLVAILFQGKELKASTDAQTLQAEALTKQLAQQEESNRLGAFSARLQFLSAEIEHMENKIADMVDRANALTEKGDTQKAAELWEIIKPTRDKQKRYRAQASDIDEQIKKLLT